MSSAATNEEELHKAVASSLEALKAREPLDPTYKRLLLNGLVTARRPILAKGKLMKKIPSRLRERVEAYQNQIQGKDPLDRIAARQPMDEEAMRAAFTLRDAKEHEQQALLEATLASLPRRNGMDEKTRKRHYEAIALSLQNIDNPQISEARSAAEQTEHARQAAALERQREQARLREEARRRRDEEERKQRQEKIRTRQVDPARLALHKIYDPIFRKLWDMEFPTLLGTGVNPFRVVIDRSNCAAVGAPNYFDVIQTPMNLTYIQEKVDNMEYETLAAFFADVNLMIQNALKYNSDPTNPYRKAAEQLQAKSLKMQSVVLKALKNKRKN